MISASPGMAGLLSSIRKDGVRRRKSTAVGGSNGRLFERRQKRNNTGGGGSSYSADRAASLQSSRERRAEGRERVKSNRETDTKNREKMNKAREEREATPGYQKREAEIKRLQGISREKRNNDPERIKEREKRARIRNEKKRKKWSEDLLDSAKDLPDWRA